MGLSPVIILIIVAAYFGVLMMISYLTSRDSSNDSFFIGKRQSPWYLVAFGMIGATLSGVTFISVPGWVASSQFSYMQMVFGYLVGYTIIATVLMPMYYKLRLTSIYGYLEQRFGFYSYKSGSAYFLISRVIGASFRLFLVAIVFQTFVMNSFGIPFWFTVLITIILIWIYTFRGGIKTIVWTDALQTSCMLIAVIMTIWTISSQLGFGFSELVETINESEYSQIFYFEGGWSDPSNFFKKFIAGVFIALTMTGLDQDMMQKNLSCHNIEDAQKNMLWFSIVLVIVKFLFLCLGALLFIYAAKIGIDTPTRLVGGEEKIATDLLYPTIAIEHLSPVVGVIFVLGLIAAAYSSADSALTALTTAFCIDFLNVEKSTISDEQKKKQRLLVHVGFSVLLFMVILVFWGINDDAVIKKIFDVASYTYGPLLGLFAFGFLTTRLVQDRFVPWVCILSPILTYLISTNSETLLWGYKFGFELLLVNGLFTFLGMLLLSKSENE